MPPARTGLGIAGDGEYIQRGARMVTTGGMPLSGVPLEVARKLPERAQQMLGYHPDHPSEYGGRLGLVDFEDVRRVV